MDERPALDETSSVVRREAYGVDRNGADRYTRPAPRKVLEPLERRPLGLCERAHLARREVAQLDRPELDADQPVHLEPEGLAHPPHLAVAPFADRDGQLPPA